MDATDRNIINRLQRGFPISERPYLEVAKELGIEEEALIQRIDKMLETGLLSRFGPMYNVERMGGIYSLVAMKVPDDDFDRVTVIVNSFPQVAHNYQRDHEFNMWFVLAVESEAEKEHLLARIEALSGYTVYDMPKQREFYVGLKFDA